MKLLIISNMAHFMRDKQIVGHGPTVREIDRLATLFEAVVHVAVMHAGPAPAIALPYRSRKVHLVAVQPSGGTSVASKLKILLAAPSYIRTMLKHLSGADVVHVRCPANISLLALVLLALLRRPTLRWVKYAGNWSPPGHEPLSYSFQRWWLRHNMARSVVTINGAWPGQPAHVHTLLNPCLTHAECAEGRALMTEKRLAAPLRLIFVGRAEAAKGAGRVLEIASLLKQAGLLFTLDIVGQGPERDKFKAQAAEMGLAQQVHFHGELPRPALNPLYARSHFILLPSTSEGWPKVLSEAMAYGVLPLASNVGSIPQILGHIGTGRSLPPHDLQEFCNAIVWYQANPDRWLAEAQRGVEGAQRFTYAAYLRAVGSLLGVAGPGAH